MPIGRRTASSKASGTGAVTPALPTGVQAGDIVVLVASTIAGGSISITSNGSIGTWTAIQNADVTGGEKIYAWWGLYSSGSTGPTVTPGSDHCCACTQGFSGVDTVSPIDNSTVGTEATSDTSFSWAPGINTNVAEALVSCISSSGDDSNSGQVPVMTNASLANLTLEANYNTNSGGGGGFGWTSGDRATAGSYGTFACTYSTASPKAHIAFSLNPVVGHPAARRGGGRRVFGVSNVRVW